MAIQFDPQTGEFLLEGKVIGRHTPQPGRDVVRIELSLDLNLPADTWPEVFQHLEAVLEMRADKPLPLGPPDLRVPSNEGEAVEVEGARQSLLEKWFQAGRAFWEFHKTDPDPWPSLLHGHHSEKPQKLDAVTGKIYDIVTREHVATLKARELAALQAELRSHKDFAEKAAGLLPTLSSTIKG